MTNHAVTSTTEPGLIDSPDHCATKNPAGKKPARAAKIRTVQSGSVTVRIYEGRNRGKPFFTVIWYIGERRMRKGFFELLTAKAFARDQATVQTQPGESAPIRPNKRPAR